MLKTVTESKITVDREDGVVVLKGGEDGGFKLYLPFMPENKNDIKRNVLAIAALLSDGEGAKGMRDDLYEMHKDVRWIPYENTPARAVVRNVKRKKGEAS